MTWLLITAAGLLAGTVAGVVGFGGTTIMMPVLVLSFGAKAAVPIMAIASILGNLARVAVWWRVIAWRAVLAYAVAAIPAAWLGARTMLALDADLLELTIGAFFVAMVPLRRLLASRGLSVPLAGLAAAGAVIGFLTGIVANTGPINTPFFLAHGLIKGPFIGTEAMSSLAMFGSKSLAFWSYGVLTSETALVGGIVGSTLMAGAWIGKRVVDSLSAERFGLLMDALLLAAGAAMIAGALSRW